MSNVLCTLIPVGEGFSFRRKMSASLGGVVLLCGLTGCFAGSSGTSASPIAPGGGVAQSAAAPSGSPAAAEDEGPTAGADSSRVGPDPSLWDPVDLRGLGPSSELVLLAGQRASWLSLPTGFKGVFAVSNNSSVVKVETGAPGESPAIQAVGPGFASVSVWESSLAASFGDPVFSIYVTVLPVSGGGQTLAPPVDLSSGSLLEVVLIPGQVAVWADLPPGEEFTVESLNTRVVVEETFPADPARSGLKGVRAAAVGSASVVLRGASGIVSEVVVTVVPPP